MEKKIVLVALVALVVMSSTAIAATPKANIYQRFCDRYCTADPIIETTTPTVEDLQLIASDVNRDGTVNIFDLAAVGLAYGTADPLRLLVADVNHDGEVTEADLEIVGDNFGKTTIWQYW